MRSDLVFVYLSQILRPLIPIFFIPLFFKILGKEEFSLVTFMSMLLGWLLLLDAGISGSLLKYVSISKGSKERLELVRGIFLKILLMSAGVGCVFFVILFFSIDYFGSGLLKTDLKFSVVKSSLSLIALILFFSLIRGFATAAVEGFEKHKLIAFISLFFLLASNIGSYLYIKNGLCTIECSNILIYLKVNLLFVFLEAFFIFFFAIYLFHVKINNEFFLTNKNQLIEVDEYKIINFFKLTFQISTLSILWVIASNIDKLVLALTRSLSEYSFYQISFQICASVMMLYIPIAKVLMPRLMHLYANKKNKDFDILIGKAFFIFSVGTFPSVFLFLEYGMEAINLWIRDIIAAKNIFEISQWVFAGFYFAAINNFSFLFFHSRMNLNPHLNFYKKYVVVNIIISLIVSLNFDMKYSAMVFFFANFSYFIFWTLKVFIKKYFSVSTKSLFFMFLNFIYWYICYIFGVKHIMLTFFFFFFYFCLAVFVFSKEFKS